MRSELFHPAAWALLCLALLTSASPASAQPSDGVYGRLSGDTSLTVGLGGGLTLEDQPAAVLSAEVGLRYLDMAGLRVVGEGHIDRAARLLAMVDLRPIFLARFFLNGSLRDWFWDLLIDSIGVSVGVAVDPLEDRVGLGLAVAMGISVPILWIDQSAMAIRLSARHVSSAVEHRLGPGLARSEWTLTASITFRTMVDLGLPRWERPRYRPD